MKSIWQFSRGTKISTRKFKKRNETKGDIWYLDRKIWLPVCNIEHMRRDHPWRGEGGGSEHMLARHENGHGDQRGEKVDSSSSGNTCPDWQKCLAACFFPLPPPSFALESVVQQTEAAFPLQLAPKKKRSVWKKGHVHCNRLSSLFFFLLLFFPSLAEFSK